MGLRRAEEQRRWRRHIPTPTHTPGLPKALVQGTVPGSQAALSNRRVRELGLKRPLDGGSHEKPGSAFPLALIATYIAGYLSTPASHFLLPKRVCFLSGIHSPPSSLSSKAPNPDQFAVMGGPSPCP